MYNFNPKDAAHLQSNYNEWRENTRRLFEVDIDLSLLGVPDYVMLELGSGIAYAMKNNTPFALFIASKNKIESLVTFIPESNKSNQSGIITEYVNKKQFLNAVKLVCITHHNIYIHEGNDTKLLR